MFLLHPQAGPTVKNDVFHRLCLVAISAALSLLAAGCLAGMAQEPPVQQAADPGGLHGLSLKPTRTVRFETDEGTWMSLDVSPDGKTIVFDMVGHLYTLPFQGGEAVAITSGLAFDRQPRFSPDGRSIVYVSDRSGADNLWIAKSDGSAARPLTADENTRYNLPAASLTIVRGRN